MEKLFKNTMKQHGAWIRMEEYELSLSDGQITSLFDVFARMEELLNTTPLDQYSSLLRVLDDCLRSRTFPSSELSLDPPSNEPVNRLNYASAPEEDTSEEIDLIALFHKLYIARGTKDDHFRLKEAEAKWPQFVCAVEALQLGLSPTALIKPDKESLRQLLQSYLRTPCPKKARHFATCTHKSAFRGWKLLDHARALNRASVLECTYPSLIYARW